MDECAASPIPSGKSWHPHTMSPGKQIGSKEGSQPGTHPGIPRTWDPAGIAIDYLCLDVPRRVA